MSDAFRMVRIRSQADIHNAVHAIRELAKEIGMGAGSSAAISTAASELVTNVIKYAPPGRMSYCARKRRAQPGIEVVVEDGGPGIKDVEEALRDNVSTGGSLGLGLPGARRLVDEFEITSSVEGGTRVRIVKWG